jgi:protein-tyrosine phosphatase
MQKQGIHRVCCLLSKAQLNRYSDLLDVYQQAFGRTQICWAPIEDFNFADSEVLIHQILPFLAIANQQNEAVVVHCSGGVGRTGHILAAWLVAGRGYSRKSAIAAVKQTGRNPYEAVIAAPFRGRNPWKVNAELNILLDECNFFRHSTINS